MANYCISFLPNYSQLIISTAFRSVKLLSWDQSQDTINTAMGLYQLLKILTVMIGHTMDVLNVASTEMYRILALIVNFK